MICISSDKKRLIYFLFLIIISSPIVFGADNFKVFSGEDITVCPGSTALITDKIESISNNPITLTISSSGSASGFSTIIPNGIVLQPNSIKTIYSYISPRTTTQTGIYTLSLNIDSDGDSERIEHKIDVKNCNDFDIKALRVFENVCPAENTQVRFELKNLGSYDETYTIEAEGNIKDWISLSSDFISLKRDESKIITAFINAPSTAEGQYFFTLVIKSQTTDIVKFAESSIIVNPCYTFSVESDEASLTMCERSTEDIDLNLINKGSTVNTYKLSLEGPLWANLNKNQITLNKNQDSDFKILLNPELGVEGNFKIDLKVLTEKGSLQGITSYNVNVKKCYDVAINIERDSDIICNSLSNKYAVNIKNLGEVDTDYILSIEGPEWAKLEDQKLNINEGDEENINLEISPSNDAESKEYEIKITAQAFDSSKVSSQDTIKIKVISTEECFQPSVQAQRDTITVNYDSSGTIPIVIENKGNNDATYSLSVTGTASAFSQLNPASLTVSSGKSEVVYLYIAPSSQTPNGNYEATISARLEDSTILATDSVKITVQESKFTEEPIEQPQQESFFRRLWNRITGLFAREEQIEEEIEQIDNVTGENFTITNATTSNITISNETVEEIIEVIENETVETNETVQDFEEDQQPSFLRRFGLTIVVIIIIILLIALLFKYRKKVVDFFSEEIEETKIEEKPAVQEKKEVKIEQEAKKEVKKTEKDEDENEIVLGEIKEKKETTIKKKEEPKKKTLKRKIKPKDTKEKYY